MKNYIFSKKLLQKKIYVVDCELRFYRNFYAKMFSKFRSKTKNLYYEKKEFKIIEV